MRKHDLTNILAIFWQFYQFLIFFEICWRFSTIFTILTILYIFWQFLIVWAIFESFDIFDNFWEFWQFWHFDNSDHFYNFFYNFDNFTFFLQFWQLTTFFTIQTIAFAILTIEKIILETCDIWDTDYNSDNWEPEFMTISVTWQLIVTLNSIRNSCDVYQVCPQMACMKECKITLIALVRFLSTVPYKMHS